MVHVCIYYSTGSQSKLSESSFSYILCAAIQQNITNLEFIFDQQKISETSSIGANANVGVMYEYVLESQ